MQTALAAHTITKVEFGAIQTRFPRLHGKNAQRGVHGYGNTVEIVCLQTDRDASGWAMLSHGLSYVHNSILGKCVSDLFDPAIGILDAQFIAYDFALHDLCGQILGLSVRAMINPDNAKHVRVYDGAIYMNDLIPEDNPAGVERILKDCADDYRAGYRMFKVKIGRGHRWMTAEAGLSRDIEIMKRLHKTFPDCELLVDGNDGFTPEGFFDFLRGIQDVPLFWIEEPFPEEEEASRTLKDYLRIHRPRTLVADGETSPDMALLSRLSGEGSVDVWLPDICGLGMTAWRARMRQIAAAGNLASPHAWAEPLKTHYCAHLAAAYAHHIPCIEGVLGEIEGVDYGGYAMHSGMMTLPETPGFGMSLFWFRPLDTPV